LDIDWLKEKVLSLPGIKLDKKDSEGGQTQEKSDILDQMVGKGKGNCEEGHRGRWRKTQRSGRDMKKKTDEHTPREKGGPRKGQRAGGGALQRCLSTRWRKQGEGHRELGVTQGGKRGGGEERSTAS